MRPSYGINLKNSEKRMGLTDSYAYFLPVHSLYQIVSIKLCHNGEKDEDVCAYFSTIYSFKGLESKIVILVDTGSYDDVKLIYTALSRARSKLYVFENKRAYEQRKEKLMRGAV